MKIDWEIRKLRSFEAIENAAMKVAIIISDIITT